MQLSELFPQDNLQNLPPSDWRRWMFLGKETIKENNRGCVSRLLEFAENQGILTC